MHCGPPLRAPCRAAPLSTRYIVLERIIKQKPLSLLPTPALLFPPLAPLAPVPDMQSALLLSARLAPFTPRHL